MSERLETPKNSAGRLHGKPSLIYKGRRRFNALANWFVAPVRSSAEKAILLCSFALLVAVRLPNVFLQGRFWAEEGTIYFEYAWRLPWLDALLSSTNAGYWNLTASGATLLARYAVPLWAAPLVTASIALIIQCLPAMLIMLSKLEWTHRRVVLLAALLIIATPPASDETWVNSINSQHHLVLAAGVILALETRWKLVGWFHAFVLLLAALSSPGSWVLLPLFGLRAAVERSRPRAFQAVIMLVGVAIQLGFFFTPGEKRIFGIDPMLMGAIIFIKHVAIPIVSYPIAENLVPWLASQFNDGKGPLWPLILVCVLFIAAALAAARYPKQPPLWFFLGGAILAGAGCLAGYGEKLALLYGAARYQLAPQVLLMLCILSWSAISTGRARQVATILVAWALVVQMLTYFRPPALEFATGADWRAEVELWKHDPNRRLSIWPQPWSIQLQ